MEFLKGVCPVMIANCNLFSRVRSLKFHPAINNNTLWDSLIILNAKTASVSELL